MGHTAHVRKQFKSINTYEYIITFIKRRKKIFESPSHKDALCQVWLKFAQWFWRRRFLNFVNVFSLFRNYLPLEIGGALNLNKLESPSPKLGCFVPSLVEIGPVVLEKNIKCEKFTDRRTDDRQSEKKAHLSFQIR